MIDSGPMKIGAAYIRVSTDGQMEYSPDSQLKEIKKFAKAHSIILSEQYIFMEEDGRSGREASKRMEFQRMIGLAKTKPKPFDVLLLWKFSRFARNREDSVVYKSMLRKKCGIEVISVSEPVGDDKMSILIEALIEAMDEYYSINLSGEVLRGMTEKATRGGVVGSPAFGYNAVNGNFVPDPHEADIVRMIFDKFVNTDISYMALASLLNSIGVRTKKGYPIENRTVKYMIENPVYIGKIRWSTSGKSDRNYLENPNVIISDGHHEPIISNELFEAAAKRAGDLKKQYPPYSRRDTVSDVMLRGIARCSSCGSTLIHSNAGYQCHSYCKGVCQTSHYIAMKSLDSRVLDLIDELFKSGDFQLEVKRSVSDPKNDNAQELQLRRELQKLDRIRMAYESGIDTLEEYKQNKQRISQIIENLKFQTKPPTQSEGEVKQIFMERNGKALLVLRNPEASNMEKNQILRTFVDKIVFDRAKNQIQAFFFI